MYHHIIAYAQQQISLQSLIMIILFLLSNSARKYIPLKDILKDIRYSPTPLDGILKFEFN